MAVRTFDIDNRGRAPESRRLTIQNDCEMFYLLGVRTEPAHSYFPKRKVVGCST